MTIYVLLILIAVEAFNHNCCYLGTDFNEGEVHPWKHLVNRLDSLPMIVKKSFRVFFWLFCAQVLNVDLCRFVTKFDFHFGATRAHPKENLITRVKDHDIIMSKVILTKITAFFTDSKIAFLI